MSLKPFVDMSIGILVAAMALGWYTRGAPWLIDWEQVLFFGGALLIGRAIRMFYDGGDKTPDVELEK